MLNMRVKCEAALVTLEKGWEISTTPVSQAPLVLKYELSF
jgi:hypothetical protein